MMEQQNLLHLVFSFLTVTGVCSQPYYDDSSIVYASSLEATIHARILCELAVECTGEANDNTHWAFFGSSAPVSDEEHRFVNFSTYTSMNGVEVKVATLMLKPVLPEYQSLYNCVSGSVSTVDIRVDNDALEITAATDVDQSMYTTGDTISVPISIETCLSNIWVSVYKGKESVFNKYIDNSRNRKPFVVDVPIQAEVASAGQYGVRAVSNEYSTPLTFFNITGSPILNN